MPGGRPPAELTYTLGRNLVEEAAKPPERHLDTTNKHFFQDLPQQARQADATLTQPMDRSFHRVNIHLREAAAHKHVSEGPEFGGSKGSRGEVTRHPREAGNPYGVQVRVPGPEACACATCACGRPTFSQHQGCARTQGLRA